MPESKPHSTPALRTPMARVWFWIDTFASEDSLQGRGNDEYWSIKFRGSDLWNLRQAVESLEEQLQTAERKAEVARIQGLASEDAKRYFAQRDEWADRADAAERERDGLKEQLQTVQHERDEYEDALDGEVSRRRELQEQLETLQKERDALFNRRRVLIAENRDLKRRLWGLQDAVREASSPASDPRCPRCGMAEVCDEPDCPNSTPASEPESAPWVRTPSTKREDVSEGNDEGQGAA